MPQAQRQKRASDNAASSPVYSAADDGFFIPNLCTAPAVFLTVLLAELVVLLHVLALQPLADFDWRALATGSLFVQWNALLCVALICALRRQLQHYSAAVATLICLSLVAVCTVVSSTASYQIFPLLWPGTGSLLDWCLRNVLLACTLAAIALRYSYLQQRVALQQRAELQLRLDALRARIRPHFLFNTLNSIASLIAVQPDRAEQAIEDVAELFRAALQPDGRDGTLDDEIHLCRLYLDIEQLRLGERLQVDWQLDPSLGKAEIPALLVQPLVENAVYHGVAQRPEGGAVTIRSFREADFLCIEIRNPMPDVPSRHAGSGQRMAIENIRQRIDAHYGAEARLHVGPTEGCFQALIRVPAR
ncbi:MAG: sensor histidine kinase [Congregibacter sp.]